MRTHALAFFGNVVVITVLSSFAAAQDTNPQPPNGVEVEIGIVSRVLGPQISNYQTNSGILSLTTLGRATPQLLTGAGFSCDTSQTVVKASPGATPTRTRSVTADDNRFCNSWAGKHLGAYVSVQFGTGSNQAISGYSFGATYALGKNLRLLSGFSMTPTSEIAPGFANAASQYVTANPKLFPGITASSLAANTYGAFDGIQTTSTAPAAGATPTAIIYYPGAVTETRYRGGFIIGVALPINVYNLFGGNPKN